MKFDDSNVDASQLQDRRGMSRGARAGVGAGGLGIIGLLLALLFGGGGGQLPGGGETQQTAEGASGSDVATRCNQPGAIEQYDDCYVLKIFNETNEVWSDLVGRGYRNPTLVYFEQGVNTACGPASSQTGPFYCPGDAGVYIDLGFMKQLQRQLGAEGRYAQAYIISHEVGHHLQNLQGIERQVRQQQRRNPRQANQLSVRMELQADCYAGVWARVANDQGNVQITQAEFNEALAGAAAVGDDRIQIATQGRTNPESWTHGSAKQRQEWFGRGFQTGDPNSCDTFKS